MKILKKSSFAVLFLPYLGNLENWVKEYAVFLLKIRQIRVASALLYFNACQTLDTQSFIIKRECFALPCQSEQYAYYETVGARVCLGKVSPQYTGKS